MRSSGPPSYNAGNLDNKWLVAGTKVYIPVHVPGALFAVGVLTAFDDHLRLGRHHRRIVPYSQATGGEHGAGGFAPDANFRVPLRRAAAGLGVEAFPGPVATSQSRLPRHRVDGHRHRKEPQWPS
jgi:hypothetical protein